MNECTGVQFWYETASSIDSLVTPWGFNPARLLAYSMGNHKGIYARLGLILAQSHANSVNQCKAAQRPNPVIV